MRFGQGPRRPRGEAGSTLMARGEHEADAVFSPGIPFEQILAGLRAGDVRGIADALRGLDPRQLADAFRGTGAPLGGLAPRRLADALGPRTPRRIVDALRAGEPKAVVDAIMACDDAGAAGPTAARRRASTSGLVSTSAMTLRTAPR